MIDGPSHKSGSIARRRPDNAGSNNAQSTQRSKRSRVVDKAGDPDRPGTPDRVDSRASTAQPLAPSTPPMQRAMELPEVGKSIKRRYVNAPPLDLDRAAQKHFAEAHSSRLAQKLKEAGYTRMDLLGSQGRDVGRNVAATQRQLQSCQAALQKMCPDRPVKELADAVARLAPHIGTRSQLRVQYLNAQVDAQLAHVRGGPSDIADAESKMERVAAAQVVNQRAIEQATPAWANEEGLRSTLYETAELRADTSRLSQQLVHMMRVVWIKLNDTAYTKLPHFAQGSFGKVSPAMREDGALRALKTLRTLASKDGAGTRPTNENDARLEIALMQRYYDKSVRMCRDDQTKKLIIDMPWELGSVDKMAKKDVALVRSMGRQIFTTLKKMHGDNVVHNDLKPENVNVRANGKILVADYGLAAQGPENAACGTYTYAAPEQCSLQSEFATGFGPDVWAAGLSLAAMHGSISRLPFLNDMGRMPGAHAQFEAWRSAIITPGSDSMERLLADTSGHACSEFFRELHAQDPKLCAYLLTKLLVPPAQRASAAEASAFFELLQPDESSEEHDLQERLKAQESTPYRNAAKIALQLRFDFENGVIPVPPRGIAGRT